MADEEDILSCVRSRAWSGQDNEVDVAIYIRRHFGELDEAGKVWLLGVIRSEFKSKRDAEKNWPKITDFDRLDRAFTLLESQGVIALHTAGFDQSEGLEAVEDTYIEAGGKSSGYAGHCFYTEQDQEEALDGRGLYIGFGHRSGNDQKAVNVGKMLQSALEREGFDIEWNGSINSRLLVTGFRWQRRSPS